MMAVLPFLQRRGFDVVVAAPTAGMLTAALTRAGVATLPLDLPSTLAAKREVIDDLVKRWATTDGDSLVHSNSLSMGRLAGVVVRSRGVVAVAHLRDIVRLSRSVISDLNRHNALVAVSHAVRRFHVEQGLDADITRVIHNGIDTEQFSVRSPTQWLHRELNLPATAVLIATIGQIALRKGVAVIPHLFESIVAREPCLRERLHWLIIGERWSGKEESRVLETTLREESEAWPIRFLGRRDDIASILPELTLIVHPAYEEPFGRVLLEAASCGVAVVARDVGGTREMLGTTARLVASDSSLASAAAELLVDDAARDTLRQKARLRVETLFTPTRAAEELVTLYQRL